RLEAEEKACISEAMFAELRDLLAGQEVGLMLKAGTVEEYLPAGTKLTKPQLDGINFADVDLKTLRVANKQVNERFRAVLDAELGWRRRRRPASPRRCSPSCATCSPARKSG